ncbi:MAG: hypothetical protein K6G29_14675 [Clostridiales bacterium]|nr:hypothetical protein [Clostridiales bacterium]
MKQHRTTIARILALVLLFGTFAGCSTATTDEGTAPVQVTPTADAETEPAPEEDVYVSDDLPSPDYDGYDYRILSCNFYNKELATYLTYDEITGDPVNDVLYASRDNIQSRFNIGIRWIETGDTTAGRDAVKKAVTAGDDAFDILIGHDTNTFGLGKDGYLYNLMAVDQFNFEKPWWPKNTVESLRIGDKMYAASSYLSYCGLHWTRVITFNKDYAEDLGYTDLYDEVREGRWTLDRLHELCEGVSVDLDGNGKYNVKDKIAFTSGGQTWYCMQEAAGIPVYRHDADGIPYLDIDIERVSKYVDIMRLLITGDDYVASGDFGIDQFKNGLALFAYTQVGDAYDTYRISEIRYGFLPTPKLDEEQADYINCCTDVPWGIPKNVSPERLDLIGTVTEAMSCYNYNSVLPAYYETAIKARTADAPDDTEMLTIIANTRTISFSYTYQLTYNNIVNGCVENNSEVASYFKKNEKVATKTLDRLIDAYSKMD